MKHATVDLTIELEAFRIAMEDGILGGVVAARFVVATVNLQTAFQFFQGAFNRDDIVVVAGIETQRVHFLHVDGEMLIVEMAVFGEELKHTGKDTAREFEILVFLEGDTGKVGHDDDAFAVAQ